MVADALTTVRGLCPSGRAGNGRVLMRADSAFYGPGSWPSWSCGADAQELVAGDPFQRQDLVDNWWLREWLPE